MNAPFDPRTGRLALIELVALAALAACAELPRQDLRSGAVGPASLRHSDAPIAAADGLLRGEDAEPCAWDADPECGTAATLPHVSDEPPAEESDGARLAPSGTTAGPSSGPAALVLTAPPATGAPQGDNPASTTEQADPHAPANPRDGEVAVDTLASDAGNPGSAVENGSEPDLGSQPTQAATPSPDVARVPAGLAPADRALGAHPEPAVPQAANTESAASAVPANAGAAPGDAAGNATGAGAARAGRSDASAHASTDVEFGAAGAAETVVPLATLPGRAAAVEPLPKPTREAVLPGAPGAAPPSQANGEDSASAPDPVAAEVSAQVAAFYAAYLGRSWKRAETCFWPNATITEVSLRRGGERPEVLIMPAPDFFEDLRRSEDGPPRGFNGRISGSPIVRSAGNVAQAWCHYVAEVSDPQESMHWQRFDAFTLVKYDGQWRIAALVQSINIEGK